MGLNVVKNLPETTVAMAQVAKAEQSADEQRAKGKDEYSIPFDRLMAAFDTFIREWSDRVKKAGMPEMYDFSDSTDLTIFLLWQIRNIRTHSGGLISENQGAKKTYEKYYKTGVERGAIPLSGLPTTLTPGLIFTFNFESYKEIKKIIFKYISRRIPPSDLEILNVRSMVSEIATTGIMVLIKMEKLGLVEIDLAEAYEHGFKLDASSGDYSFPSEGIYLPNMNKICFASTGECIKVRIIQSFGKKKRK